MRLKFRFALVLAFIVAIHSIAGFAPNSSETLPLEPVRTLDFDLDEGTWISLDISPDGKTIIFELLGDLYAMDAKGGDAKLISGGMPFDSQPTYSPDGSRIAFISDRSGNENLWVTNPDGSHPRQLSNLDDNTVFISPAWSADGRSIFVSTFKPDLNAFEIWNYTLATGKAEQITHAKSYPQQPKEYRNNALGAVISRDGRYLYYEEKTGLGFADDLTFPLWRIVRRDLRTGEVQTVVRAQGSAMRPVLSPNGNLLVYATRFDSETGLRVRNLDTGDDRWLAYPVQHDDQEGMSTRDLLPRYTFTPDGKSLILNYGGKIQEIDLDTHEAKNVPFRAHVRLPMGPQLRVSLREDTGPVRARLIQDPSQSPDGKELVFSALGRVYLMVLADGHPRRLTAGDGEPEFQPSWSPDGRSIVYVTWTARGGAIWRASAIANSAPTRLTDVGAYYTNPVFTPDGRKIVALRSSNYDRMHTHLEFGPRHAETILLPADGGATRVITSGVMNGTPQFTGETGCVYLYFQDGLYSVQLDGSNRRRVLQVNGPGFYFQEGSVRADDVKISPDGKWVLAQIVQQLYVVAMPPRDANAAAVELADSRPGHTKLTTVGADFFAWADGGKTITWALGSTFYRRALASVPVSQKSVATGLGTQPASVEAFHAEVEVPRDTPHGAIVLRGATAITMKRDEIIENADVVVVDNRIAAAGKRGEVPVPPGAEVRDVTGKYIIPGFVDVHLHWGEVRRGVLDLQNWGFLANLAYGITTGLDPSPLSIDMLAYEDLVDAGLSLGPRVYSTGPAIFSYNNFTSLQEVLDVLSRYRNDYRTLNLKEYRTGNRRQREWVAQAAHQLGIMPTTEGALDMKLDLTQVQDGFAGNEHAFTAVPLNDDIVQLFARTRTSYTPTLEISNGGLPGEEYFLSTSSPHDDPKVRRFIPHYVIDQKTQRLRWARPQEYLFPRIAAGAAKIMRAGGLIGVGSHGQFAGLACHWELEALSAGGLTPHEILRAATIQSSEVIGRSSELGSIEPGKFADLQVLDQNPLADIRNALSIREVMKNGRLYDADTLDELWPEHRPLPPLWFWQDQLPPRQ